MLFRCCRSNSRAQMSDTEGTWCFWAPEMCGSRGEKAAFNAYAADAWAVGVTLWCFLYGTVPFIRCGSSVGGFHLPWWCLVVFFLRTSPAAAIAAAVAAAAAAFRFVSLLTTWYCIKEGLLVHSSAKLLAAACLCTGTS